MLIFQAFRLLRAFQERHIEHVSLAASQLPDKVLNIRIPSDAERVIPTPKNGISRFDLEVGFPLITPESRGRDISNHVCKVRILATDLKRKAKLLNGTTCRVVILLLRPLDS